MVLKPTAWRKKQVKKKKACHLLGVSFDYSQTLDLSVMGTEEIASQIRVVLNRTKTNTCN